ncbi:MAG: ATP-dependent sacrificial sulfur transferase LarE [Candidatus Latescibacterota bacterium]
MNMEKQLNEKYQALIRRIGEYGSVAIAFSGGVDSTFLAKVCHDVLKEKAVALTIVSEAYPPDNIQDVCELALYIGVRLIEIPVTACAIPEFAANEPDRCYHCKRALFGIMREKSREIGAQVLIDGSNADDLGDYRPGKRALFELGIQSPLQDLGFTKKEIRMLSKELQLPTWDRQSFACLASRFPYGERITQESLKRTWKAESLLKEIGMRQYRVRNHGDVARIELDSAGMKEVLENPGIRSRIIDHLKALGYRYVTLDLQGYRVGSMNETIDRKGAHDE